MSKENFNDQYCLYPWISLEVSVAGNVKPCCKYEHPLEENNKFLDIHEISLEDAFKSKAMGQLRYEFASGEKPSNCRYCWEEESAGVVSMRQSGNNIFNLKYMHNEEELAKVESPKYLDLKFGNICNLKCRICDPFHSTTWFSEYEQDQNMQRDPRFRKIDSFMNEKNWEVLKKWLPGIHRMNFFGGEPLLQKDFFRTMDLCISEGFAKDIAISINTNTSIYSEKVLKYFKEFQEFYIMHSIDDIGARFEYQRNPAKWEEAEDNIKKYYDNKTDSTRLFIYVTVNIFNVYYVPDILEWAHTKFPEHEIIINHVFYPAYFSIGNLPNKLKSEISQRLKFVDEKKYNFLYEDSVTSILNILDTERNEEEFNKGLKEIKRADDFRGESFAKTFPEISEYFKL